MILIANNVKLRTMRSVQKMKSHTNTRLKVKQRFTFARISRTASGELLSGLKQVSDKNFNKFIAVMQEFFGRIKDLVVSRLSENYMIQLLLLLTRGN